MSYCSFSNTETTSTSCTIAATQPRTVADVIELSSGDEEDVSPDAYIGPESTTDDIGPISSSIHWKEDDVSYTWNSTELTGRYVAELKIYSHAKVKGLPKKDWWKHAVFHTTIVVPSNSKELVCRIKQLKKEILDLAKNQDKFFEKAPRHKLLVLDATLVSHTTC